MNEHILLAYGFDGKGSGKKLAGEAIAKEIKSKHLVWVHLDASHHDASEWLHNELSYLDPFIVEALLEKETRPRMTEIDGGVMVILRGVNLNKNAEPEDIVSIRLWIDENRIISMRRRRRKLKAVTDMEEKIKAGRGPKNAGEFLCMLTGAMFAQMESALNALDDLTDDAEEKVSENPDTALRKDIVTIRKQAIMFRRHMAPQRDMIGQLRMSGLPWLTKTNKRHLQENYNLITRYVEDLDAIRGRAQIIQDELFNALSDRLNKNMYILSVIAAVFLPLGFLTGLLGINVGGIPGAHNPDAFWMIGGGLIILALLQILIFKKLKWF